MSDADSFIQEVSEEVRRDRMFGLWKRYGPFVLAAVVAAVAAAGVDAWLTHQRERAAREAGATLLQAAQATEATTRAEALLAAAEGLEAGPAMIARLRAAAELAAAGDAAAAVQAYRKVAEDPATEPAFAGFAAYRAAVLDADRAGPQTTIEVLRPLAAEGQPFRPLALEAMAALKIETGDAAGARADLEAVIADPLSTQETKDRASRLLTTLPPVRNS